MSRSAMYSVQIFEMIQGKEIDDQFLLGIKVFSKSDADSTLPTQSNSRLQSLGPFCVFLQA